MRLLILSTYEHTGGAAIAASRLLHALQGQGVEATMLCRRNIRAGWLRWICPPLARALEKQSWTSIAERAVIWACNGFTKKDLWATDIALFGQDITTTREYREADVVLIHWVNQGFLSLSTIEKIAQSGKRVVWTMHDEWPLEGVEHYTSPTSSKPTSPTPTSPTPYSPTPSSPTPAPPQGEGEVAEASCETLPTSPTDPTDHVASIHPIEPIAPTNSVEPIAPTDPTNPVAPVDSIDSIHPTNPIRNLLVQWVVNRKAEIYRSGNISFVTCSEWLKNISEKKKLAVGQRIVSIPNPIDSCLFAPLTEEQRKEAVKALGLPQGKKLVLFVAQKVDDERKGIRYLDQAVKILTETQDRPETPAIPDRPAILDKPAIPDKPEKPDIPDTPESPEKPGNPEKPGDFAVIAPGRDIPYINNVEDMARLYACVDVFVTPSLSDNLPNTIMEAMSCGTPCVGFDVGGIPEMIDHKENGYVARYKDAQDLAEGIRYVTAKENNARLSRAARNKVMQCYSEEAVASKYLKEIDRENGSFVKEINSDSTRQ